jgi:hypothetical protein
MQISYLRPRERDVNGEKKQIPMMSVGYVYSANDIKGIKPAETLYTGLFAINCCQSLGFLSINPTILLVVFLLYESIKFVFFLSLLLAILFFSF